MWQVEPLYYFHIKLLFLFCEAINIRCHGMASEEETFTKALGKRYSGEEGPIRRGDRIYKNKNSWRLMGPDRIYWKDFHRGWTQTKPTPHGHAPHYSSRQIWQLVPVAKPCGGLPLPPCNWMFSSAVTKITCDPPLLPALSCLSTLYTRYHRSPRNRVLTHHTTIQIIFDSVMHFL